MAHRWKKWVALRKDVSEVENTYSDWVLLHFQQHERTQGHPERSKSDVSKHCDYFIAQYLYNLIGCLS